MGDAVYRWGAILAFSLLVSVAFLLYGIVFQRLGSPPETLNPTRLARYFLGVVFDPLFVAGMGLAFGGALLRMVMFDAIGVAATALAGQFTIVLTVVFAVVLLGDSLSVGDLAGMALIMAGVYLVQAEGVLS
jgi:drug/metabolite transporter (DMT)-like permease